MRRPDGVAQGVAIDNAPSAFAAHYRNVAPSVGNILAALYMQAEAGRIQLRGILRVRGFDSRRLLKKRRADAFGNGHSARHKVRH